MNFCIPYTLVPDKIVSAGFVKKKKTFFVTEKLITQNIDCLQLTYLETVTTVPPFPFHLTALLFLSINVIPTLRLNW